MFHFRVSVSRKLGASLRKYKLFQSRFFREKFWGLRPESPGYHFQKYKKRENQSMFFRVVFLGKSIRNVSGESFDG